MAFSQDDWVAIWSMAGAVHTANNVPSPPSGIKGRFLATLVRKVLDFYGRHQAELNPFLTQLALAALQALITAKGDIDAINPPGPE